MENQILLEDDFAKALNNMTDKKKNKPKDEIQRVVNEAFSNHFFNKKKRILKMFSYCKQKKTL